MDLQRMATELLQQKLGANVDTAKAQNAVEDLLGGAKGLDLGDIVGRFTGGSADIAEKAKSWLGDGANAPISAEQIGQAIGPEKISEFASKLGVDAQQAGNSLSQFLPEIIDKCSRGGNLIDANQAASGLKGMLGKFFK